MGPGRQSGSKQMNLICIIIMACENESGRDNYVDKTVMQANECQSWSKYSIKNNRSRNQNGAHNEMSIKMWKCRGGKSKCKLRLKPEGEGKDAAQVECNKNLFYLLVKWHFYLFAVYAHPRTVTSTASAPGDCLSGTSHMSYEQYMQINKLLHGIIICLWRRIFWQVYDI